VTGIYSLSVHLNLKKVKVIDAAAVVDGSDADADLETAGSGAEQLDGFIGRIVIGHVGSNIS